MLSPTQPFTYSFSRSYFENFKANLVSLQSTSGAFNVMFEDYWKEKDVNGNYKYRQIDVDGFDKGISLKTFVQNVYNGDQQICLVDKVAREIGQAVADVFDAVGLGDVGCKLGNVISKIFDKFTDAFGSFICTATAEMLDTECARDMLAEFKNYRDTKVMTTKKGQQIVRYYQVLGPKIVEAIDKDEAREFVYNEIMQNYLMPLRLAVKNDDSKEVFRIYFRLMEHMIDKYKLKVGIKFRQWAKDYNGLCKN